MAGSAQTIKDAAHLPVLTRQLYVDGNAQKPAPYGVLDKRLVGGWRNWKNKLCVSQGTTLKNATCDTCHLPMADCIGHFGYLDLELPVFHVGFFRQIIQTLQCLCKVSDSCFVGVTAHCSTAPR